MNETPGERARSHRQIDEALTQRIEMFLTEHVGLDEPFTAAELAEAIGIERFCERDAQLLLVALKGQGRVHCDQEGWYPGRSPSP
jgi:hypothetical protein